MASPTPASSSVMDTGTRLAYERTRIAYERTMMAWVRTGTSLITFGFSVYKFFQMETAKLDINAPIIGSRGFALVLIGIGLLSLMLGTIEHGRDLRAMREQYPGMPRSMSAVVAILIAVLGVAALLAVLYRA
jgi:putative membrane protein